MTTMMRIGEGWDVHALVPGRALVVGGVTIDHPQGENRISNGAGLSRVRCW